MITLKQIQRKSTVLILLVILTLSGCVTIPSEAPELSTELGNRISSIEKAHIGLLHSFFDEKRSQVDVFVLNEWVPTFAEEIFKTEKIAKRWDEVVKSGDKVDRLEFLVRLGPRLQAKINSKRLELVKPLDDLERSIERKLRDEYQLAKAINNSITSFLVSASKVDENRRRYLETIGVTNKDIAGVLDEVDSAVNMLLGKAGSVSKGANVAEEYLAKLNNALESIKSKEGK
ncbi:MAG: hypothetical protein JW883_00410 [Deltaproteobacteria bacterium]|nr:hypothetical protein [Deltaproteobacteria bacterium]